MGEEPYERSTAEVVGGRKYAVLLLGALTLF